MASRRPISALKLSLGLSVPLFIDLTYQEGYLVPSTFPNVYTESRLKELSKPSGVQFATPPSLTFTRYHTENPWHAQYIYAKKSFWRYKVMWSSLGLISSALQLIHVVNSAAVGRPAGAIAAVAAIGLTWTGIIVEGKARKMFLDEMHDTVVKEEETLTNASENPTASRKS
jgi:hypothetical protein